MPSQDGGLNCLKSFLQLVYKVVLMELRDACALSSVDASVILPRCSKLLFLFEMYADCGCCISGNPNLAHQLACKWHGLYMMHIVQGMQVYRPCTTVVRIGMHGSPGCTGSLRQQSHSLLSSTVEVVLALSHDACMRGEQ